MVFPGLGPCKRWIRCPVNGCARGSAGSRELSTYSTFSRERDVYLRVPSSAAFGPKRSWRVDASEKLVVRRRDACADDLREALVA
jgi:hypothetical protein